MLAGVRMRKLESTKDDRFNNYSVEPKVLEDAIKVGKLQFLSKLKIRLGR